MIFCMKVFKYASALSRKMELSTSLLAMSSFTDFLTSRGPSIYPTRNINSEMLQVEKIIYHWNWNNIFKDHKWVNFRDVWNVYCIASWLFYTQIEHNNWGNNYKEHKWNSFISKKLTGCCPPFQMETPRVGGMGSVIMWRTEERRQSSQPNKEIINQLISFYSRMVLVEEKNLTMPYHIRNFSFFRHMQDVAHPHQCEFLGSTYCFKHVFPIWYRL